ncbi:MAG: AAA family ATPase [Treponema sp.]|nr:AAA family ATPase [Treponema sp.]MCL2272755.1 AAA family ATPase [Treponema sp.]
MENNKNLNILVEQNNTSIVKFNFLKTDKYGYLDTGYFNFKNSIVSVDIDGKYYNLSSGYRKQFSNIYKLAFGNKESLRFNVLEEMDENTAYNDAFEIANILIKNSDIPNENKSNGISDCIRDFLITLILHVKCSDFKDKSLYGCLNCFSYYENNNDENDISNIFDNIINSCHCSSEIHEIVRLNSKRFIYMNKNTYEIIYHRALSLLNIFQNYNLRNISSQSDFCVKDFVMNKSKSLYITLPSSGLDFYRPYIDMVVVFIMNKVKKYYSQNVFNRDSVLFFVSGFKNTVSSPFRLFYHNRKYIFSENINLEDKINLPLLSSRNDFLKECKRTLKLKENSKKWFHIPEEIYMQSEEILIEPFFTTSTPDEEVIEKLQYKDNDDDRLKKLFKPVDFSSSVNKDSDYERNKNNIEIIFHREIKRKNMYYTPKNENEIKELYKIFSHNTFDKLMDHFNKKGQRQGFICILAGSAGTGKTETVLQLAKLCKRNIVKYDATQISSGFIGIATGKVNEIFDSYEKVVKNSKNNPILFLNEADSIFSRRMDLSCNVNQVSCLDENRTQSILLESLENFKGIMIATTNLISNFDAAFERRFLYRIVFDKPDKNTRMKILNNMLPELKEEESEFIVNNYELTGAQIENISRKLEIKKVINNNFSFDDINSLCRDETDNCFSQENKTIGFK